MNAEQFIIRFRAVLYTAHGWEDPLTMERLDQLLATTLADFHAEQYGTERD